MKTATCRYICTVCTHEKASGAPRTHFRACKISTFPGGVPPDPPLLTQSILWDPTFCICPGASHPSILSAAQFSAVPFTVKMIHLKFGRKHVVCCVMSSSATKMPHLSAVPCQDVSSFSTKPCLRPRPAFRWLQYAGRAWERGYCALQTGGGGIRGGLWGHPQGDMHGGC